LPASSYPKTACFPHFFGGGIHSEEGVLYTVAGMVVIKTAPIRDSGILFR